MVGHDGQDDAYVSSTSLESRIFDVSLFPLHLLMESESLIVQVKSFENAFNAIESVGTGVVGGVEGILGSFTAGNLFKIFERHLRRERQTGL